MFLEYNRSKIEGRYEQLRREFPDVFGPADEKINGCREPVALALKWMYGAMPWSDRGNYPLKPFWILQSMESGSGRRRNLSDVCRRKFS